MALRDHCFHAWRFGYPCCCRCGLVGMKNEASRKACRAKCPGKED